MPAVGNFILAIYRIGFGHAPKGDNIVRSNVQFTISDPSDPSYKIVVHGTDFGYSGPKHLLTTGEVSGFEIFHGSTLTAKFTNLNMDAADFQSAMSNYHAGQPIFNNIFLTIHGSPGNDVYVDNDFSNDLFGRGGNDTINGRGGDDYIDGGLGINHLHGGAGFDSFFFRTANGVDIINDFTSGVDDIWLSRKAFGTSIGPVGPLAAGRIEFHAAVATHPGTRFFVQNDGDFYYDSNGSAAGHAVLIGKFTNGHLPQSANDFHVFA